MKYIGAILFFAATACFARDSARMDQVVQSYTADKEFMGTVLVARDGAVLLNKGYGSANLEWNIPNTPTTKFRLGSITKQFTAAAILLLEERGKLKVTDPVKMYMPDAPAAWDKITIFNVLTHTAGIPNFTSFPEYPTIEPFPKTPEKLVALFRDKPLDFAPGEKWNYSNSGYVLLGYLIEKISGQPYAKFIQDNIFTPVGMKDSGYDSNSAIIPHRAAGYAREGADIVNAGFVHMSIPYAAGSLYSTTEDLLRWETALFGGKVLSAASLTKMTTPFKNDYAFGLAVVTVKGRKLISHNGGIEGFATRMDYYPDSKTVVILLSNMPRPFIGEIASKLTDLAYGEKVVLASERTAVAVPASTLLEKTGVYKLSPNANFLIKPEGDHLTSKLGCQQWVPVFPESENMFFAKVVDAKLEFGKDDTGKIAYLILHQNGRDQKAPKIADELPPEPVHKEITVSPNLMAEYAGTYEIRPGLVNTITLEDGHLMIQVTGQRKFQLYAESETKFFLKEVEAVGEFMRNDKGAVSELVMHQCGRDIKAARQ